MLYVPYGRENSSRFQIYMLTNSLKYWANRALCSLVRKGSVTHGLGADISLPPCLSERPGIWRLGTLRLKATSGSKSRGASSRYSALATRLEVPFTRFTIFLPSAHAQEPPRPLPNIVQFKVPYMKHLPLRQAITLSCIISCHFCLKWNLLIILSERNLTEFNRTTYRQMNHLPIH